MSPLIREFERTSLDYFILHTGQHYSFDMDSIFFEELELPEPKYNLNIGSDSHARQTGRIMAGIEEILDREQPRIVLVQGDTNTVLAGALTAAKKLIKIGHVEAGLRSFDRAMPEEINRIVADHLSEYLFAPTSMAKENLLREGIDDNKIYVTGNTIVDSIYQNLEIARKKSNALEYLGLKKDGYFLVTAHRQENVDSMEKLKNILKGLELLQDEVALPILFPMHPRTRKMIREFGYDARGVDIIEPLGFLDFIRVEASAKLVLTDSGGVQEETCILRVPCVTLRDNTERPETLEVGSNMLVGTQPDRMLAGVKKMLSRSRDWINPLGDGRSSEKILNALVSDKHLGLQK
jgi:UDP-N-acetylglucosamine 2-epimerase (non-hydrolysing)